MPNIKLNLNLSDDNRRRREKEKIIIHASNLGIGEGGASSAGELKYVRQGYSVRFDENIDVSTVEEALDTIFVFESVPPSIDIRKNPNDIYYEVGDTPSYQIGGNGHLGQNPVGQLTLLKILKNGADWQQQANPNPDIWYDFTDDVSITATGEQFNYIAYIEDDQGRNNYSGYIRVYGTYPWYATTQDILTLTKQNLGPYIPTYFQASMVAETDTYKQKADFEAGIAITGIQFYNTVSGQWERLNGSKDQSLNDWDITSVTHTIQGKNVNYNRYTHTGAKVGARQLRFYTN